MLLMNSENDPELDAAHIRFFQARRVDGMILSLASERRQETLDILDQVDVPVIMVDRDVDADLDASIVRNDHRFGMRTAVGHLLDLGHRRIALITGALDLWPVRERIAGMAEAVAERGVRDETISLVGSLSAEHGDRSTEQLLAMDPRPTAIIAGGNQVLAGCVRALHRHGIRIPEDISLVTCDEVDLSELHAPPIAVGRPRHAAARPDGRRAAPGAPQRRRATDRPAAHDLHRPAQLRTGARRTPDRDRHRPRLAAGRAVAHR